jgi:sugar O-acyltransferase (sialic acid O-acetyltransferase NeuD family)
MKQKLLIVGAGSVGKFIAYNIEQFTNQFEIIGYLDDDVAKYQISLAGYPVLGSVDKLYDFSGKGIALVFGIAFPEIKRKLYYKYQDLNFDFPSFISLKSWISESVSIGQGCIIYPGTSINYECAIDDFVVINMNCSLGHNCSVSSFSSLAPGVNFAGHTKIGKFVEVGIGASTIQGVVVHDNAVIGGQAMIVNDVVQGDVVVGIPARSVTHKK